MENNLLIGIITIIFLFTIQVIIIFYNRYIIEKIHQKKLGQIREIKAFFNLPKNQ